MDERMDETMDETMMMNMDEKKIIPLFPQEDSKYSMSSKTLEESLNKRVDADLESLLDSLSSIVKASKVDF